jgi:hypothetical protein
VLYLSVALSAGWVPVKERRQQEAFQRKLIKDSGIKIGKDEVTLKLRTPQKACYDMAGGV